VPVIVTAADLGLVPLFSELAVNVIVPSFVPDTGDTSSQLASSVILQVVLEVMVNVPLDPEAEPSKILVGDTFKYGVISGVYVQYMENLKLLNVAAPKAAGMPPDHVAVDCALAGVPAVYLTPILFSNTQASHTVCPDVTAAGLVRDTVCHPAVELMVVDAVTPRSEDGSADRSE